MNCYRVWLTITEMYVRTQEYEHVRAAQATGAGGDWGCCCESEEVDGVICWECGAICSCSGIWVNVLNAGCDWLDGGRL